MEKSFVRDSDPELNRMRTSEPNPITQEPLTRYKMHDCPYKRKPDLEEYDSRNTGSRMYMAMLVHGTLRGNNA